MTRPTFKPLPPTVDDIADANWNFVAFVKLRDIDSCSRHPRSASAVQGTEVTISFDKDGVRSIDLGIAPGTYTVGSSSDTSSCEW